MLLKRLKPEFVEYLHVHVFVAGLIILFSTLKIYISNKFEIRLRSSTLLIVAKVQLKHGYTSIVLVEPCSHQLLNDINNHLTTLEGRYVVMFPVRTY